MDLELCAPYIGRDFNKSNVLWKVVVLVLVVLVVVVVAVAAKTTTTTTTVISLKEQNKHFYHVSFLQVTVPSVLVYLT
jgi:hypothetical protein